jgi:acyl carrier protein phosphodiesterase
VNFFAHVSIATLFAADDALAFGAMLPDFASLLGSKPPTTHHPRIQEGCLLHHSTDAVFHALPLFKLTCREQSVRLAHLGLERGSAMAAAHVGLEFLLDDVLAQDAPSRQLFRATLAAATAERLAACIDWQSHEQATRFQSLRNRLLSAEQPDRGMPSFVIAERVYRTLLGRPRLAIRSEQRASLARWVSAVRIGGTGVFCSFIEQAAIGLCSRLPQRQTRPTDSLQFRRAWDENL